MRFPPPLACAIGFAGALAVRGLTPPGEPPAGAVPDDRIAERIEGVVGGPVVRGEHGWGAALDIGVWVWSERPLVPGQRIAATGRLRTPRGMLDPGVPDRAALAASRGAEWELTATSVDLLEDD